MSDNLPAISDNSPELTERFVFEYDGAWYFVENNKLYNHKHEVAVVYSPDYGGGWSTWRDVDPTDARVAVLTMTGAEATLGFMQYGEPETILFKDRKFYPYLPSETHDELDIVWLPAGTLYKVEEYDGAESVIRAQNMDWRIT